MKIAYLITAYDNPTHFGRLLDAVLTTRSAAYVHIDAKFDIKPFEQKGRDNVQFLQKRVKIYWGQFSLVEAVLRLMQQALDSPEQFDYLTLISGTDYPIRPIAELETFLAANRGTQFMNLVEMPNEAFGKPLWRLQRYKPQTADRLSAVRGWLRTSLAQLALIDSERNYKKALGNLRPFGGSTWWSLTREACQYVLDFVKRERRFVQFYRYSMVPDEGMIHTIIGNSPLAQRLRRNLSYTDWRAGGNHPQWIGPEHLQRFLYDRNLCSDDRYGPGEVFFARKFSDRSSNLVDQLEVSNRRASDDSPIGLVT